MMGWAAKGYNPDKLVLSKNEIIEFCDRVLDKWSKEPTKNAQNILAMNAVRAGIYYTDEDSLKAIWTEILYWTFDLMFKNAIAQAKEENVKWSPVLKKLEKEKTPLVEPGAWF